MNGEPGHPAPVEGGSSHVSIPAPKPDAAIRADTSQPESIFDALRSGLPPVVTTVEVRAAEEDLQTGSPEPFRPGGEDIQNTAGTYGDVSRYLQLLPGVVGTSDMSNQMLVRGGHPLENLFLVDGFEVPNINHLANANTTGGLGPMIDAAAIQGLKLHTGGFDAKFPERLSSVTELQTLDREIARRILELDLGIQGFGGLAEARIHGGDLLVSAHHGLLNLVSGDVGINGVPSYTNALTRYRRIDTSGNHFTALAVAGEDSIEIEPCAADRVETSTINSQYRGWRETAGAEWQQVYSNRSFGVLNLSDSEQVEHIHQQDQILNPEKPTLETHRCPIPHPLVQSVPVYLEDSNNAFSTAKYLFEWQGSGISITSGSSVWLQRPNFDVAQPIGAFSPYVGTLARTDSASFDSRFSTGESGTFSQVVFHPTGPLSISAGGRMQTFAFGGHMTLTPRLNASYRFGERAGLNIAYATYAQLPPYAYLIAFPVNRSMLPMRVTHKVIGMDFGLVPASQFRLEAYQKEYRDIPASTEYPAVTMNTMIDMIGQQLVWLPMNSMGRGEASGLELSDITRMGSRLQMQGSVAYSRAKFAGSDGILRPSNFDFPWIANMAAAAHLGCGVVFSARYGYATGRPYTPFNMTESLAQNRPVYDLARVNVPRAPYYSRLDAQINKDFQIRASHLEVYAGVDNLLNRSNFLSYAWMPRVSVKKTNQSPVGTLWQTPIFPNFGLRFVVR